MELVYKYNYGNEELLGACIVINKHDKDDLYTLSIQLSACEDEHIPIVSSTSKIITHDKSRFVDEIGIITMSHRMVIHAPCNPPPETLWVLTDKRQQIQESEED